MILTAGSDGVCSLINPTTRLLGLGKVLSPEVDFILILGGISQRVVQD